MSALSAFILLAAMSTGTAVESAKPATPVLEPAFKDVPKGPNGLSLYNAKGEVVARCEKKGDAFGNCKIEAGYTLDDLMNAWVHAYQEMQK
ncbi:MAG TPA: hypothetical protein VG225_16245 [Terracidiphilus sp.]|jgi:hypothetical protein|nr:hypothetical protein [Terracidiphilus sp.]